MTMEKHHRLITKTVVVYLSQQQMALLLHIVCAFFTAAGECDVSVSCDGVVFNVFYGASASISTE